MIIDDSMLCFSITVRFSNGSVKNANKLDFTMFKKTNEINPNKKSHQILVRNMESFYPQFLHP